MHPELLNLAATIVEKSDREHPADSVLRNKLREQRGLSRDDGWQVSRAVFAYFRWFGWLEDKRRVSQNISLALELADTFRDNPQEFSNHELVGKSVPKWIHEEIKISPEIARALQAEPRLWLRSKRGQREELARRLRNCSFQQSAGLPDALGYTGSIDLFCTQEFHEGLFELQDISSQAVGVICNPQPGETWWDACAGEGGKTLHLSELMQNKGLIWASDRAEWRLRKLKQRAGRAKVFNYRAAHWDGGKKLPTKTKFDGILVDAPCSGVGTWQRNPHARWTTTIEDVRALASIQSELLANVASALKPGGKLIYSVCTLTRTETSAVADEFSQGISELMPLQFASPFDSATAPQSQLFFGCDASGGNGMFVAGWRSRSSR